MKKRKCIKQSSGYSVGIIPDKKAINKWKKRRKKQNIIKK